MCGFPFGKIFLGTHHFVCDAIIKPVVFFQLFTVEFAVVKVQVKRPYSFAHVKRVQVTHQIRYIFFVPLLIPGGETPSLSIGTSSSMCNCRRLTQLNSANTPLWLESNLTSKGRWPALRTSSQEILGVRI